MLLPAFPAGRAGELWAQLGLLNQAVQTYRDGAHGPLETFTIKQAQRQIDINVSSVMRVNGGAFSYVLKEYHHEP